MSGRAFDEILARYPSWVQPRSLLESLGGAGGQSGARLWRYGSEHGLLVLRAWPADGPGRKHLEQVHDWLFKLAELGFIPVPIRDRAGRSLQDYEGRLWEIAPWLAGTAAVANPPGAVRLCAVFAGLAAVHDQLGREQLEAVSPGLRRRYEAVTQLVQGGFDVLEATIQRQAEFRAEQAEVARRWLSLARVLAPLLLDPLMRASALECRLQPCLRDARPEHFLFDGDRLSGLVDFGAMGVDSVAGDLARLIGEWLEGEKRARGEALAAYEGIRPLQPAETDLIGVFESSADLLIGERWLRWHYLENRRFEDSQAVSNGLARGLKRLERLALELT
ncbi:MAG: phosphotransferase enzyme family protein [Isosphaerales bacterium]